MPYRHWVSLLRRYGASDDLSGGACPDFVLRLNRRESARRVRMSAEKRISKQGIYMPSTDESLERPRPTSADLVFVDPVLP